MACHCPGRHQLRLCEGALSRANPMDASHQLKDTGQRAEEWRLFQWIRSLGPDIVVPLIQSEDLT